MEKGWICLHRSILDWEWYDDINTTRLFIHCLLRANHAPKKWRGIEIKRGQFWTSTESLSRETGLTKKQVRLSLEKMASEVASSGQARGRMITVINYENYQEGASSRAGKGQAKGKLRATNNNDNNETMKTNKDSQSEIDSEFERIWEAYGRKGNKKTSQQRWSKLSNKAKALIFDHVPKYVKATPDKQYRKNMETYLNQMAWEDEIAPSDPVQAVQKPREPTEAEKLKHEYQALYGDIKGYENRGQEIPVDLQARFDKLREQIGREK